MFVCEVIEDALGVMIRKNTYVHIISQHNKNVMFILLLLLQLSNLKTITKCDYISSSLRNKVLRDLYKICHNTNITV